MSLRAPISIAASGAIIAAPLATGQSIAVIAMELVAASAVTVQLTSVSAVPATTNLTGAMSLITGVPLPISTGMVNALSGSPVYALICNAGDSLQVTLGGGVQVSGWIVYDLINGVSSTAGS